MLEKLRKTLEEQAGVSPGSLLVVGVSGGPDSLCLLDLLRQLNYKLVAAHLNHGLRPEAEEDAGFVRKFAKGLGVAFVGGHEDTNAFVKSQGFSVEEAARFLRYRFLFNEAVKHKAQAVVVGHNADDQVETVLMHLLRGTGMSGLRGMQARTINPKWDEQIPLVRPLLGVWRKEILAYCDAQNLQPRFDRSNLDTTYYRNRLRHELLPELGTYNPQIKRLLWQLADTMGRDHEVLTEVVDVVWEEIVREVSDQFIILDVQIFNQQLEGVRRGISRRAIAHLRPGLRDIDFAAVERVLDFAEHPTRTNQRDLAAGLRIQLDGDKLILADWQAEILDPSWPQAAKEAVIPEAGKVELGEGWVLITGQHAVRKTLLEEVIANDDPFIGWVDADILQGDLKLRIMQPGDRFRPMGMDGHSLKLADFFINVKLPKAARAHWPLVCVGNEVVWVPGFRLAHPYRVREETERVLKLVLFKE